MGYNASLSLNQTLHNCITLLMHYILYVCVLLKINYDYHLFTPTEFHHTRTHANACDARARVCVRGRERVGGPLNKHLRCIILLYKT